MKEQGWSWGASVKISERQATALRADTHEED